VEKRTRRKFGKEFKIEAVKLVTERGMKVTEVSRDLGISKELLYRWKNDYETSGNNSFPGEGKLKPEDEDLRKLRRELANVKEERDILKKAIAIFSKAPNPNTNL
jgi:transposase